MTIAQDIIKHFRGPLSFLDGKYKQHNLFRQHDSFVIKQSINFGMRLESRCNKAETVYDTYEYVSVQETLMAHASNEQYTTGFYVHTLQEVCISSSVAYLSFTSTAVY
jgi:hypothetical protein